ncbi:DUF2271 domain-containing protein [Undibacterium sp.]|jgi:hypothetical protein|uniref:DUF2271 domain-containing protein n=1 Tax=Undibacterium sp. TaxID=1914977 RepID=UPI002CFC7C0F|nr:DUF2271 domain-containing protein [Undibacterium sp.]HTD04301.1 DUF2271 domain-containing protein [Undibacterium sp.]
MRVLLSVALTGLVAPVMAADLNLKVEVPRLNVAEYHRPYVAIWIERPDQSVAGNLAVWYDMKKKDNEGNKWLKDIRQWWRRSGRDLHMPVDGISGATRPAGEHQLSFPSDKGALAALPAGDYQLVVEAAREGGGREVVKLPFKWQAKGEQSVKVQGGDELGLVSLNIKP